MENKKIEKPIPAELKDETLDNISGGLLKPIILNVDVGITSDIDDTGASNTKLDSLARGQ